MQGVTVHSVHSNWITAILTLKDVQVLINDPSTNKCGIRESLTGHGFVVWMASERYSDVFGTPKYDLSSHVD